MSDNRRFGRKGCFTCKHCKKRTRETGENDGTHLCPLCCAKVTCGNNISDRTGLDNAWGRFDGCKTVDECWELCQKLEDEWALLANPLRKH